MADQAEVAAPEVEQVDQADPKGEQEHTQLDENEETQPGQDGYEQDGDEDDAEAAAIGDGQDMMGGDVEQEESAQEEEEVGPLVISEAHENFRMDKKLEEDPGLGSTNTKHLLCELCEVVLVPEGYAVMVKNEVNLVKNTLREYDICSNYWYVD